MLVIPDYPRHNWRIALGFTAAALTVAIVFGYGIPMGNRIAAVNDAQTAAENVRDANQFWRMLAGQTPLDGTDLGRLASTSRDLADSPDPISAMEDLYIGPGDLPDIGDTLGFHAFERPDPHNSGNQVTDGGHFTDSFILRTLQATGHVAGSSADDLIRPVPSVPAYGWLRWEWAAAALALVIVFTTVFGLWLRKDRRRWPALARARALAELTSEQRDVLDIIEGLERQRYSEARDTLLCQAKDLFRDMSSGLGSAAQQNRDKLAELRSALDEAQEGWRLRRDAYDELPCPVDEQNS